MKNIKLIGVLVVLAFAVMVIIDSTAMAKGDSNGKTWFKSQGKLGVHIIDPILTDKGYISGTVIDSVRVSDITPFGKQYDAMIGDIGKEVRVYRGIPYAAPPVGELRWKPPQSVTPWLNVRECTKFSPMAPQSFPAPFLYESIPESGMSEDCLYLNVLTPAQKMNERLPVIVWFHGGGLTIGSSNPVTYNTGFIPQHGAVVVTVQHRLGPIGYLAHPALSAESSIRVSGNYGQLDLIAALEWIQRNIASFGGNPDNVTIIGQSGGGQKVLWLMCSPLAEGLFHRVICESGGIGGTPLSETEQYGLNLAETLGVFGSGPDALEELRTKSWQELITAANSAGSDVYRTLFTVDGWSMPDTGPNILSSGRQNDVPLIIGYAGGEMSAIKSPYTLGLIPNINQESNVYVYLFTHIPQNWAELGAYAWHGSDVAYQFGTHEILVKNLGVFLPISYPYPEVDYRDEWVADFMASTLVQFAKTGDPNPCVKGKGKKQGETIWPSYDSNSDLYLDIGYPPVVGVGFSTLDTRQPPRY